MPIMQPRGDVAAQLPGADDEPEIGALAQFAHMNEDNRPSHNADICFGLAFTWADPHWDLPGGASTNTD